MTYLDGPSAFVRALLIGHDDASDFLQTEGSFFGQSHTFSEQSRATLADVTLTQFFQIGFGGHKVAHFATHPQDLVEPDAAFAAGVKAFAAAFAADELASRAIVDMEHLQQVYRRIIRGFAVRTDGAGEALGDDSGERSRDLERFDAHVAKSDNGAGAIVGMQRAEDEMAGQ
jgi:hypothetical protein